MIKLFIYIINLHSQNDTHIQEGSYSHYEINMFEI